MWVCILVLFSDLLLDFLLVVIFISGGLVKNILECFLIIIMWLDMLGM